MKKYFFQVGFSSLILVYLLVKADWDVFFETFQKIDIRFYLFSTGMTLATILANSNKFHWLLKGTNLALPVTRLMRINLIARFYSLFIPTALGPAAVRWYKVTKNKQGKSFFLASTIVERIFFLLVLMFCGTLPLFFYTQQEAQIIMLRQRLFGLMVGSYTILFLLLIYFFVPRVHRGALRLIDKLKFVKEGGKLDQFLNNFSLKNTSFPTITVLFLFSLLWQFFFLCRIFFLFKSIYLPLSFQEAVWIGSLVMLLQVLPVSVAGLGVREGAYAYFFSLYGLPAEKGVVLGLLFFSQMLILAGTGAVLNLFEKQDE